MRQAARAVEAITIALLVIPLVAGGQQPPVFRSIIRTWGLHVSDKVTAGQLYDNYGKSTPGLSQRTFLDVLNQLNKLANPGFIVRETAIRPDTFVVFPDPLGTARKFGWYQCTERLRGVDIDPYVADELDRLANAHAKDGAVHGFYLALNPDKKTLGDSALWRVPSVSGSQPEPAVSILPEKFRPVANAVVALGKFVR